MNGVVSLLDDEHDGLVRQIWSDLEEGLGLRGVYVTPYPHFSYHVARSYDFEALAPALRQTTASRKPFTVTTGGLGIFTGPSPVLYVPVVRSPELTRFHQALWQEISRTATGSDIYYAPERWLPHITLGFSDLDGHLLAEAMRMLGTGNFNWEISISNVAVIRDTGKQQELRERFDFGAA